MDDEILEHWTFTGTLKFFSDSFAINGKNYAYSTIEHIERHAVRTTVNLLPVGDITRLDLYCAGLQRPITVQTPFLTYKPHNIQKIYERISSKTFVQRLNSYLILLKDKGFFEYGGAQFFPDGDVLVGNWMANLKAVKLERNPFNLTLVNRQKIFFRRKKISTLIDQDVFASLLSKIYGISLY